MVVLAERPDAALSVIADAAEVSRSTLHRHFPGREELIHAVDTAAKEQFMTAIGRAQTPQADAVTALVRISHELLSLGPVLGLIFNDHAVVDADSWTAPTDPDVLGNTITRGHADGTLDTQLDAVWIETCLWTLLFGAWQTLQDGAPIAQVMGQLTRTVEKAFGA